MNRQPQSLSCAVDRDVRAETPARHKNDIVMRHESRSRRRFLPGMMAALTAAAIMPAFASQAGSAAAAPNDTAPVLKGTLVAHPAAASQVKWPVHNIVGKDFWHILVEEWREKPEFRDEAFVKNAGFNLRGMPYSNRGVPGGLRRKTNICELEVYCGGKDVSKDLTFDFSSAERETIFYDMGKAQDGNPGTSGYIVGDSSGFRTRNAGVPVRIVVSNLTAPVEKIRFLTDIRGCAPMALVEVLDEAGNLQNATYERSPGDSEWALTFVRPIQGKSFVIRAETGPSFFSLAPIPAKYKELFRTVPFLTHNFFFRDAVAELKANNIDIESMRKLQREYPETFVGQIVAEVDANYFQQRANPTRFRGGLEQQGHYVPVYDRDRMDAEAGLRTHIKRHFDFFGNLPIIPGGLMTAPYLYEWGAPLVAAETYTEPPSTNSRSLITIGRSGARQYGKPWGLYMTSYALDATASNVRSEEEARQLDTEKGKCKLALDFGLAPSVLKRLQYLVYYSGGNFELFENDGQFCVQDKHTGKWSLTDNGRTIEDLYDWSVKPEGKRGELYAPILLLTDYLNGNWEYRRGAEWKVWYMLPYQDGDYMFQHVNRTFDLHIARGADKASQLENGWSLANSKLGDIYDIFFANPPSGVITLPELGKYPVVFMIGDISYSAGLLGNLKKYVELGGTLIINAAQDKAFFADPAFSGVMASEEWLQEGEMKIRKLDEVKGQIVAKSASGAPLIVKNAYGKGNVIFMTPYFLLNVKDKKQPLPLIPSFLEQIQSEVCPVQVSGNIHFLLNKMSGNQWKLVLFNHRGVYKNPYRTKQEVDPQYAASVTITASEGTTAKEVRLNQPVTRDGNKFTVTIPSGEICVVNLDSVNFAEAALNADAIVRKGGFFDEQNRNRGIHLAADFTKRNADIAADSSGKNNHGKIVGAVYAGNAFDFDGKGAYVVYPIATTQDPISEGTLECWAKPDSAMDDGKPHMIMTNEWIKLGIANGRWNVNFYETGRTDSMNGGKVECGKWHHLVFTWKKMTAELYVDGVRVERPEGPLFHMGPLDHRVSYSEPRVFLGTHHYVRESLFKGLISGVRYYGHYLTEEDVAGQFQKKIDFAAPAEVQKAK